jgi:signal transduction histidine kinase
MRERMKQLGGRLEVSPESSGTSVTGYISVWESFNAAIQADPRLMPY